MRKDKELDKTKAINTQINKSTKLTTCKHNQVNEKPWKQTIRNWRRTVTVLSRTGIGVDKPLLMRTCCSDSALIL